MDYNTGLEVNAHSHSSDHTIAELPEACAAKHGFDDWRQASQNYAEAVAAHVTQTSRYSLLPHENFRWFARYLHGDRHPPSYPSVSEVDDYSFVTIHDLTDGEEFDSCRKITELDGPRQLEQLAAHKRPCDSVGQILFLRGFPTCEWLRLVGSKHHVNPEFFRRHMEFKIPTEKFFDLPGLPSSNDNIVKLYVTTIGRQTGTTVERDAGLDALNRHWESLKSNNVVGHSIVRRFNWHTKEYFSVEQHINISVVQRDGGWTCVVLSDSGRELSVGPEGPWFRVDSGRERNIYLPVLVPSATDLTAKQQHRGAPRYASAFESTQTLSQIHGLFISHLLDPKVCAVSPFYALHNLYKFVAASESQFLNMIQVQLDVEYTFFNDSAKMQQTFDTLKYQKEILHDHVQQLESIINTIANRGSPTWPRCMEPEQIAIAEHAAETLLADFIHLLKQAMRLSRECAEGIEDVRNAASLAEARKAIQQAHVMGRLTMLASIFVPLSFTSSFFGMNFREFGAGGETPSLRLWVWFAVSGPLFVGALFYCLWDKIKRSRKWQRRTPANSYTSDEESVWSSKVKG